MLLIQVTAKFTEFKSEIKQKKNRLASNENPVISA